MSDSYDAVMLVSFGGPEKREDVIPFLENVLRGKNVPRERMLEVAEHYYHFGGVSPINQQNRNLLAALRQELADHRIELPVYWGNRNWHPLLADTLQEMRQAGVRRCLAVMTSAFSCYSGCRQYREDLARALEQIGGGLIVHKLRVFFNHPGFVHPMAENLSAAWSQMEPQQRSQAKVLFTAHSIPQGMSDNSRYVVQLQESCRLIADKANVPVDRWELVYQSRSGPPTQPWLEPDVCDRIEQLVTQDSVQHVVIVPVGFVSDHMEVLFDLDTEAKDLCEKLGVGFQRVATVGTHPRFIAGLRELIEERIADQPRLAMGALPANHDFCPLDCCLSGRPGAPVLPTVAGIDKKGT